VTDDTAPAGTEASSGSHQQGDLPENLRFKAPLLDSEQMARVMRRMAGEILERNGGIADLMLVGIRTRGVPIAEKLAEHIAAMEGEAPPIGILDITLYRDDLSTIAPQPVVKESRFPEPIEGRTLVLCDDVLYTGRTIRAALDALLDYGRPKAVQLAVLVDRGWRELPIHADFVGETVKTAADEVIKVSFESTDGHEDVQLLELVG
jgi:pyrimidine operon attenuation protein / uracil phosphoribosyltransferase